ncbi:hypothetical protein EX30DRAFT_244358 [Ascodesmis nigricans]|uniref:INO80 complex subunit B-like conserved region domain-containing protein n=1 Tax=Ascodesmis nigricans TaxID=341454 RepID=A0A4S2MN16_9PEZI|nr:hypothetical protein EX30DRAFT_244358 [Ascodesmis nigricans]
MPPKSRAPQSPKRHELSSDDDDLSDLSDIDDRYSTIPPPKPRAAPAVTGHLSTDSEEDAEGEEDDEEEEPETPEDVEEDYASPDDDAASSSASDSYDDDDDAPPKANAVRGAAAASVRAAQAKRAAAKPTKTTAKSRKPVSPSTTRKKAAPSGRESMIVKLRVGKERLRAATRNWRGTFSATATTAPQRTTARKPPVQSYEEEDSSLDPFDEDEDAEGEEDDEMMFDQDIPMPDVNMDNDMLDSDGDTLMETTDMSRLTNRQRTRMGDITTADHLLELPSGYGKSNKDKDLTLTAQEQELKRAEMARRRKHLTDQRLHEEKMDTINRLLKKQTPKMRGSRGTVGEAATPAGGVGDGDGLTEKPPPPNMLRWVSRKEGNFVGVPESWLASPVGDLFMKQEPTPRMRRLVEEID